MSLPVNAKEAEVNSNHEVHPTYHAANGNSNELGRQISVTLSPQQFEELYLQPSLKSRQQAGMVKTFGNPTALGIVSFLLTFTPTCCCLMGWRGSNSNSVVSLLGAYYFMGGLGLYVAGVMEFIIGNTFPALVFTSFATFWLSFGTLVDPEHMVLATLTASTPYYSPIAFYLIFWSVYVSFLTVAALRTNAVLVWILGFVALTFATLGAAYFKLASNDLSAASDLSTAAGALGFAACMGGFWILFHLCLAATDFPYNIPLFDLGFLWRKKGADAAQNA
ncbi:hypothetical protein IE53DRAFT_6411 [Violaceomyces palustris]|uniref:Uncharacterized protein n=1 Tax=Violaceomyces palustris TaxID=1673888 RepID=A0ACD0NLW7_9BASI|nr:hypothetical protein IE53DRAFT_6411 [Violaceomyces palustris]